MDEAARTYARRVLWLHLALLVAVIALVGWAAFEVYERTRDEIVAEAKGRQELLARQTASAIKTYYGSIASDLSFLQRTDPPMEERGVLEKAVREGKLPPPPRLFEPLWGQLEGRASMILYLSRASGHVIHVYPESVSREEAMHVAGAFRPWITQLKETEVSPFRVTREGGINLVAVPLHEQYVLAAVVPVAGVEDRFLDVVSRDKTFGASLVDESGMVMATSDLSNQALVPATMPSAEEEWSTSRPARRPTSRPARRAMKRMDMEMLRTGTTEFREPVKVGGVTLQPRLVTTEPAAVAGRTFHVIIGSPLKEITAAINTMYGRAFVGAVIVILSVTGILLSTALRLIRARQRLETMRHEMLTKELDEARRIQLNWLPGTFVNLQSVRIAAVNQTANHISGDFYDFFQLPDGQTVVTIGDVTGHGMSAAFLMATTQLLVRTTMPQSAGGDPGKCLESVNRQLCMRPFHGQFVTMLILVIDDLAGTLTVATAGHMPPLVDAGEGFKAMAVEPQLVLGVDRETEYPSERIALKPGASVVLYTDGLIDAARADGTRFTSKRMLETLDGMGRVSPEKVIDGLVWAVAQFRGATPLSDDLTAVAFVYQPGETRRRQGDPVTQSTIRGMT